MSDYPRTRDFFAAVAASLLAGDIRVAVRSTDQIQLIEVVLVDGTRYLWSNGQPGQPTWAWTAIVEDTTLSVMYGGMIDSNIVTGRVDLAWDAWVDEVATMIATYDYGSPAEYPSPPHVFPPLH